MPWCPHCDAYRAPSAVMPDGSCPVCRAAVERGSLATRSRAGDGGDPAGAAGHGAAGNGAAANGAAGASPAGGLPPLADADESLPPAPWHLKLLGVAVAAYLGLRAWQGVELLIDKL